MKRVIDLPVSRLALLRKDWTEGLFAKRVLATKHGVDVDDLTRYAREAGWDGPDLDRAIAQATTRAMIDRTVSNAERQNLASGVPVVTDSQRQIDRFAQVTVEVVESHRRIIARGKGLADRLLRELEDLQPTVDHEAINGFAEFIEKENPELAKALRDEPNALSFKQKVALTATKIEMLRTLAQPIQRFVELERQNYGLDKGQGAGATYDDFLNEIHGEEPAPSTLRVVK